MKIFCDTKQDNLKGKLQNKDIFQSIFKRRFIKYHLLNLVNVLPISSEGLSGYPNLNNISIALSKFSTKIITEGFFC